MPAIRKRGEDKNILASVPVSRPSQRLKFREKKKFQTRFFSVSCFLHSIRLYLTFYLLSWSVVTFITFFNICFIDWPKTIVENWTKLNVGFFVFESTGLKSEIFRFLSLNFLWWAWALAGKYFRGILVSSVMVLGLTLVIPLMNQLLTFLKSCLWRLFWVSAGLDFVILAND